ncbi:MAG: transcriptional repressor [Bacteroidales bacterium]|nr:transcriptional repressor [Bacteroidales bacterium]
MSINKSILQQEISQAGLKVTPQRIAVLEAVISLGNHPTVDEIVEHIKDYHPSIATGTVYKSLEAMKEKGLIKKSNH